MPRQTVHVVQAFQPGRGRNLKAEQAISCKDPEEARRKAERLAPNRAGVVAYTASGDAEMGDYDEHPAILFRAGNLPPPWSDA